jgi:glycosyltransferase involved in cell wall biosynthesis
MIIAAIQSRHASPPSIITVYGIIILPSTADRHDANQPMRDPLERESIDISIVMPCLNERQTLAACIGKARTAIEVLALTGEIVVADNGSTDGSQDLARSLGARVVDVPVRGYGAALIWGIREARGRYVVMGDADDSYDFREAVGLVERLAEGFDLVVGTRLKGRIMPGAMPWKNRYLGTPVLTAIVNTVYGCQFSDVNCGMRAFQKTAFEAMHLESNGMEFASEMLVKAAILGLKTSEVPITLHVDGRDRAPHLRPWADGWRHLKYILLFAPKLLYWFPGSVLMAIGVVLNVILAIAPSGESVYLGALRFGDHWVVVAALTFLLGYELILTGLLAHLYTLTHRLQRQTPRMSWLVRVVKLETIAIVALLTLGAGLGIELSVIRVWFDGNFGPMNAIRPAVMGMTLILIGTQTLFSGLFYAVLSDRYQKVMSDGSK